MRLSLLRAAFFACAASGLLAGCGSSDKKVEVNGKVVFPSGMKLIETDTVTVEFLAEGKEQGGTGTAKADGAFQMKVPPGKYKVAVTIQPYPGEKDSEKRASAITSALGKFERKSTPLTHEVTADPIQTVTIDLVKGTVSK